MSIALLLDSVFLPTFQSHLEPVEFLYTDDLRHHGDSRLWLGPLMSEIKKSGNPGFALAACHFDVFELFLEATPAHLTLSHPSPVRILLAFAKIPLFVDIAP